MNLSVLVGLIVGNSNVAGMYGYDIDWIIDRATDAASDIVEACQKAEADPFVAVSIWCSRNHRSLPSYDSKLNAESVELAVSLAQRIEAACERKRGIGRNVIEPASNETEGNQSSGESLSHDGRSGSDSESGESESENTGSGGELPFDVPESIRALSVESLGLAAKFVAVLQENNIKTIDDLVIADFKQTIAALPLIGEAVRTRIFNKIKAMSINPPKE